MFICQITGRVSREGDKPHRIVVATRAKTYENWDYENEEKWFSYGTEIVKEVNASDDGKVIWEALSSEEKADFVFVTTTHDRG